MIRPIIFGLESALQEFVEINSNHDLTLARQLLIVC